MIRLLSILLVLLLSSCDSKKNTTEDSKTVIVTNYPIYWMTEYIAGNTVEVIFPVPSDIDPAYWNPKNDAITQMQQADLIFLNGAGYEKWQNSVELPVNKIVDCSKNCKPMLINIKDAVEHEHNGKSHAHDGVDFNTWLDAYIFSNQADEVTESLSKALAQHKELYAKNLIAFKNEIKDLFIMINDATVDQNKFLASHPVYNYLAKSNNWELINFHWEPNEMPNEEEWAKLKKAVPFSKYMLFEDTPSKEILKRLTEMGIEVITFRPCGNTPPSKDFLKEMKKNLKNLKYVIQQK
jgi:zinc transport system substrate-binding protein